MSREEILKKRTGKVKEVIDRIERDCWEEVTHWQPLPELPKALNPNENHCK